MPSNVETDPFFELLTDALRAGPGSPQWRDAVAKLRESGSTDADEYRLLIRTREDLENGRDYRTVRAGTGFTSKLLNNLGEQESDGKPGFHAANAIAIVCGVAILAALVFMIYRVVSPPGEPDQQAIEQLDAQSNHFLTDITTANFTGGLPEGWKQIGALPLDFKDGLQPADGSAGQGGGAYFATPVDPAASFMLEATVTVPKPGDAVWLQAFASADENFSADRGIAAHELVWSLQGSAQSVVADGNVKPISQKPPGGTYRVRLIMNRDLAIVEVEDQKADGKLAYRRVWAGAHHMGSSARFVGVRFLCTRTSAVTAMRVNAARIARG